MKRLLIATAVMGAPLMAASGFADNNTMGQKANPNPNTPALTTDADMNAVRPAAGANSFTESQAKQRLSDKGYTNISALTSDDSGVWRGTAKMKGATHKVAVDYQGNVTKQ
jgi:hypothetical protein